MTRWGLVATFVLLVGGPALAASAPSAVDRSAVERDFQTWLVATAWPKASADGVARATFDRAVNGISLDWTLPELVPPGAPPAIDQPETQAEFKSPAPYFDESEMEQLVKQGRPLLAKWQSTLTAIEAKYGVPGSIVVAIWARETDYGTVALPDAAIRTLATEAFMGERKDLFAEELEAAFRIVQHGDIAPEAMRSSWAGGLGQPQFQPRLFEAYAVDFDGDGKRDIWNSVPDTLASIANFLAGEGWQRGLVPAIEVTLPGAVSCALEGTDSARPVAAWAKLGVASADGTPLPATGDTPLALTLPAGRAGPAFLTTQNFAVIKQYNRSDLYALYVADLAQRYSDDHPFRGRWGDVGDFTRGQIAALQGKLVALGHDVGTPDGLIGDRTRVAIGEAQSTLGLPVTCLPSTALIGRLQ